MKKILSLLLVGIMVVSMVPTAFATTDYSNGTQVEYDAAEDDTIGDINGDGQPDNTEYYTVTVPALMAPGASGNVTAKGTWASNRKLIVTADEDVTLVNNISNGDEKVLDVTFPGIELAGSNISAVTDTKEVSIAGIDNALFGTWSGTFYYNVEMADNVQLLTHTIYYEDGETVATTIKYEPGMTWKQWVYSDYNKEFQFEGGQAKFWLVSEDDSVVRFGNHADINYNLYCGYDDVNFHIADELMDDPNMDYEGRLNIVKPMDE